MSADPTRFVEAREGGAEALLRKPFDLDDLRLTAHLPSLQREIPTRFRLVNHSREPTPAADVSRAAKNAFAARGRLYSGSRLLGLTVFIES